MHYAKFSYWEAGAQDARLLGFHQPPHPYVDRKDPDFLVKLDENKGYMNGYDFAVEQMKWRVAG